MAGTAPHGLRLTPETVTEFTGRIETARAILNQVQDRRNRVRAIRDDIEEYQALIRPVADKYGVALDDPSHPRTMEVANLFVQQLDTSVSWSKPETMLSPPRAAGAKARGQPAAV